MSDYQTSSRDFMHPEVNARLRKSGVFLVANNERTLPSYMKPELLLVDADGQDYLKGNEFWLRDRCRLNKIPVTVLAHWKRLTNDLVPIALFQTDFGAMTLKDALEKRSNRSNPDVVKPEVHNSAHVDRYTNEEDTYIDQNGSSSELW